MADIPGNASTRAKLPIGQERQGIVEFDDDSDWYRVSLEGGRNYTFKGQVFADPDASEDYAFGTVVLKDGRGRTVAGSFSEDYDFYSGGFDYRPQADGTYFLAIESSTEGGYEVAFKLDTPAEPPTNATLSPGQERAGEFFTPGDEDVYRIQLKQGEVYDFAVLGEDVFGSDIEVLDSRGQVIATSSFRQQGPSDSFADADIDALVEDFRAPSTGTFYLRAEQTAAYRGAYSIAAERDADAAPFDPDAPPSAGDDLLVGDAVAVDTIDALAGNDLVYGRGGNDVLGGGDDSDAVFGGNGNDILDGDDGRDFLYGESGNDTLRSSSGFDTFGGGAGRDAFVFDDDAPAGIIEDFAKAADTIDLSGIDARTGPAGDQAFRFVGTKDPTGAGQLGYAYEEIGDTTVVSGYTDGDDFADFRILLDGKVTPAAGDFVL